MTPEFYSEYRFLNVKSQESYSDKISLLVLNLKTLDDDAIEKEPENLYIWANMFKAQSWEELKMVAKQNPYIEDVVVTYHEMTEDEKIREQCFARALYEWDKASCIAKGKHEGEQRLATLINKLLESNRSEEIAKVATDEYYRQKMYQEFLI